MRKVVLLLSLLFSVLLLSQDFDYPNSVRVNVNNTNNLDIERVSNEIVELKNNGSYRDVAQKEKILKEYLNKCNIQITDNNPKRKWQKYDENCPIKIYESLPTKEYLFRDTKSWGTDYVIAGEAIDEKCVSIASSSNGVLFAAFEEYNSDNGHYRIKIKKSTDGGKNWTNWYIIWNRDNSFLFPDIAIGTGSKNRVMVSCYLDNIKSIFIKSFNIDNPSDNQAWWIDAPEFGGSENIRPRIITDKDNIWYTYIAWMEEDDLLTGANDLYYSRLTDPVDGTPSDPLKIGTGVNSNLDIGYGNKRVDIVFQKDGWPGKISLIKFNENYGNPDGGFSETEIRTVNSYVYPRIALSQFDSQECIVYCKLIGASDYDLCYASSNDGVNFDFWIFPNSNSNALLPDIYFMPFSGDGNNFHFAWWENSNIKYMNSDDLNSWSNPVTVSDRLNNSDDDFVSVCADNENNGMVAWVNTYSASDHDILFQTDKSVSLPNLYISTNSFSYDEFGRNLTIYVTISNNGSADISSGKVSYYLSTNDIISTQDIKISDDTFYNLAQGSSTNESAENIHLDNYSLQDGSIYYVGAIVDPDNANEEIDEDDNSILIGQIKYGIPDLTITNPQMTYSFQENRIDLDLDIENIGEGPSSNCNIGFYLSDDNTLNINSDYLLQLYEIPELTSGSSIHLGGYFDFDDYSDLSAGNYILIIKADVDNNVKESNENNNEWSSSYFSTSIYETIIISDYTLFNNFPNPFNPTTYISYDIPKKSDVKITILDISGRFVENLVNKIHEPGHYQVTWDATGHPAGVYLYRITAGSFTDVKKCILLK